MAVSLTGQVVEIWFLYLIGALMISARIYCRTKLVGLKNYNLDDYLILGVAAIWTAAPVIGHVFVVVAKGRHTSDLTFEERQNMPPEEYHESEYGSKIFLVGLIGYFFIIWVLKFNMLCFYQRVVILGINVNRWKKAGLYFIFSLGFFCMFAAVLRFTLIFHFNQRGVSALWSMREDCVGIVVGQAPLVTPMLRRRFWVNTGFISPGPGEWYPSSRPSRSDELSSGPQISTGRRSTQLSKQSADPYSLPQLGITKLGTESEEEIVRRDSSSMQAPDSSPGRTTAILVEHTVEIESRPGRSDHAAEARTKHWYNVS
ncbi:hypothetical protein DL766_009763 [Monosporascus sp. MC13-8B]|uniref:Rhodopsin domain-containing protein n=1 Tax=Monosporascus cannonballus TaxID=155416 RepID=A0ABY0GZY8_9PEZI|nr:hypothetical protein DL762_007202 [Monosporascus cannonballus]RYO84569.1 hypothetical protein DL763_007421 [Monosporascus cannonballus]RYP14082.1 hypothetical protein DL766_009763 [Monosporascus sp. MC13-8B]